jgi:hypothetical protein
MGEGWAKIIVRKEDESYPWWDVHLESDLRAGPVELFDSSVHADCLAEAHEWSRRLGGIPVEVDG